MKKTKIVALGLLGVVALAAVLAYAFFPEEKIRKTIYTQISAAVEQPVSIGKIGLTFFPPGISIQAFSLGDEKQVSPYYVAFNNVGVYPKLLPLLQKKLVIKNITIDSPVVRYRMVDSASSETAESTPTQAETSSGSDFELDVDQFDLIHGTIEVLDQDHRVLYAIRNLDQHLQLSVLTDQTISVKGQTSIKTILASTPLGELGRGMTLRMEKDLRYIPQRGEVDPETLSIKNFTVYVDDIPMKLSGEVFSPSGEDPFIDLELEGGPGKIKNLLSYMPSTLVSQIKDFSSDGSLEIKARVQDKLSALSDGRPNEKTNFWVKLSDGSLKSPNYPDIKELAIEVAGTPKWVTIKTLRCQTPKSQVQLSGNVSLLDQAAAYNLQTSGTVDFQEITTMGFPEMKLTGTSQFSLSAQGKTTDTIPQIGGTITMNQVAGNVEGYPAISGVKATTTLKNKDLTIDAFSATVGKSDFSAKGKLSNLMAYAMEEKDAELTLDLSLSSNVIDYDELFPETQEEETTEDSDLYPLLKPISGVITAKVSTLRMYGNQAKNVDGKMILDRGLIKFSPVSLQMFAGDFTTNGQVTFVEKSGPTFDLSTSFSNIKLDEILSFSPSLSKITGLKDVVHGTSNIVAASKGQLKPDYSLILSSLTSNGSVEFLNTSLEGHPIQKALSKFLESPSIQKLDVSQWKQKFSIENGKLFVKDVNVSAQGMNFAINGWQSIDGSTNMDMDVLLPKSFQEKIQTKIPKSLLALVTSEQGIQLPFTVAGQQSAPKLTLNEGEISSKAKSNAQQEAKESLQTEGKETLDKVVPEKTQEKVIDKAKDAKSKIKKLF
ncbi:MAG: AsmA-like C-terminal region-containing protein [Bdellovibrionota bacterium]